MAIKNYSFQMLNEIRNELNIIKEKSLFRELRSIGSTQSRIIKINGKNYLNFSSNNYLGLTNNELIKNEIIKSVNIWGTGSGSSRLISGNSSEYNLLEDELAYFKSRESSLVYPTGYMANVGVITSLVNEKDAVILDRLNHASIIDGAKLSSAKLFVYKHCDTDSLEKTLKRAFNYRRRLVITDSIFSMDGDTAPLKIIVELCEKYNAGLIVDEAHAFGIFGENGKGLMNEYKLTGKALIDMGTFSKAAGSLGGYISCDKILKEYLVNTSRSLIYTTGLPPYIVSANRIALKCIENSNSQRQHLLKISDYLRIKLRELGFDTGKSISQIIPVIIGSNDDVLKLHYKLSEKEIFIPAIRFPTVPKGTARLRISLTAEHTLDDIERLLNALKIEKY
jgi:8-amino-7-oxononanoate synthase